MKKCYIYILGALYALNNMQALGQEQNDTPLYLRHNINYINSAKAISPCNYSKKKIMPALHKKVTLSISPTVFRNILLLGAAYELGFIQSLIIYILYSYIIRKKRVLK